MAIQVLNTSSQLSGKTIVTLEATETITGVKTFTGNPKISTIVGNSGGTTLNVTGNLIITGSLTTNGQIAFPAVDNPSADPNTLDDYEEGTYTPTVTFGGGSTAMTFSVRTGAYTKIGRLVNVEVRVAFTAKGSSTGLTAVTLPFTAAAGCIAVGSPVDFAVAGASLTSPFVIANGTTALLVQNSGTVRGSLTDANFTNTTDFRFSLAYRV